MEQRTPRVWKRLGIRHLFPLVPILGIVLNAAGTTNDNSFLWHVRAGTMQLEAGEVMRADPFSATMAGEPWRTQSWLAELGYGQLEGWWPGVGWSAWLVAVVAVVAMAAFAVAVYASARSVAMTAAVATAAMVVMFRTLVPRPVIFMLPLLAALLLAVRSKRLWWTAIPLVWVWAAIHGSFVLGIGLVALEAFRQRERRLGGIAAVSVLAASVTAHGFGIWQILWQFLVNRGALEYIREWDPPDLAAPAGMAFLLIVVGVLIAAIVGKLELRDLWVIVPMLGFGVLSARNLLPAALVLGVFAARGGHGRDERLGATGSAAVAWVLAFGLVVATFGYLAATPAGPDDDVFPPGVATALGPGPVFHDDSLGGYLIYATERRVFIDDRAELYGEEYFARFQAVRRGIGYEELFAERSFEQAVVLADSALASLLMKDGWTERLTAGRYVVLDQ